ncbi:hypothetical protein B8W72_09800 [Pseudomonas putida]|uniref:Uncharacterized protein n=1 Tax=Pseudomonas putida TaxID=303 RepID=A0A1Y3L956_PSEPU|nr:hypothetical protein B8W72_09800 [Pseudomonas putida]
MATGCLGWSPRVAWETPVVEIVMAWEAKVKFLRATNPFGGAEPDKPNKVAAAKELRMGLRVAAMGRPGKT